MSANVIWDDIKGSLEARLKSVNAEIAAYPAPIPGCDAQFNHLLEERGGLARELTRLVEARGNGDAGAAESFAAESAFLADNGEKQQ